MRARQLLPLLLLFTQTACVGAVMAAANSREVDDRLALKQWIPDQDFYEGCSATPIIAPIIYHDFDRDGEEELIVDAESCKTTPGADMNLVLTRTGESEFAIWDIPALDEKSYEKANLQGAVHYRYTVRDNLLIATWRDETAYAKPPLSVRYQPISGERRFALYDITYGK